MAESKRAYKDTKTIADLKEDFANFPRYVYQGYFDPESLNYALSGLDIITEENKEYFLEFVHHIDKTMSMAGTANANRYHKIPTILAAAIYYAYYPEKIEDLDYDELAVLAKHAIPEPFEFYQTSRTMFSKELLSTIHNLGDDFMYRSMYTELAEYKITEGKSPNEVTKYFKETPKEKINQEGFTYSQNMIRIGGYYL